MADNPKQYAKLANEGVLLGYPVKIRGQHARPDNGIKYHSTIKYFDKDKDHPHAIHELAQHLPLNPPDAKNTQLGFDTFKDRFGNDVHVITLHGNSADKLKEHNGKFAHMGFPSKFAWTPHISVDKQTHENIKNSGAKTAHEAGISFGDAELKQGQKTLKTYHHKPDTTEPMVPDESDFTAKMNAPKTEKSENTMGQKPLMKPYVSEAQRRWAHTSSGKEALGGNAGVHEWDEATKGKKLPEKVSKSEESNPIPPPNKTTHKELTLHHGTKSPSNFESFDMKNHASGFYPGIYTTSNPEHAKQFGRPIKVGFKGHLFEIKDPKHAEQLHQYSGGGGGGHKLVQKLRDAGYHGIKRGNEHIIFDPKDAKIQKSESEVKLLIKKEHSLHSKHSKALALSGDSFKKYIEDNKELKDRFFDKKVK